MKTVKSRVGPLGLSLLAAALTAVAFAAISVAQDDGKEQGNARNGDVERADHPGPPPMMDELSAEDQAALEDFRSCMEDNGAPAPPKPPDPSNGDTFNRRIKPPSEEERAKIDKAYEACKDKLPEGVRAFGPGGPGGPGCGPGGPPPGPPPGAESNRGDQGEGGNSSSGANS